ncbi:hypothetical protein GAR06_04577 [Micromonospora saelicesensis]|nr:hypothetical protein GAR06_04577 [Micromonospora saelicesensis]
MPQSHNALRAIASRPIACGPAASEPLLWDEVPTTPRPQRPLRVGRAGGGV